VIEDARLRRIVARCARCADRLHAQPSGLALFELADASSQGVHAGV
jgi:hypothetical protein